MPATLAEMAKKKTAADAKPSGTETVRVETDLARMLTMLSIRKGVSVSELISPQLRPWVEEQYRRMVKEMAQELSD